MYWPGGDVTIVSAARFSADFGQIFDVSLGCQMIKCTAFPSSAECEQPMNL